jgi:hypothetical protein
MLGALDGVGYQSEIDIEDEHSISNLVFCIHRVELKCDRKHII